MRRTAKGTSDVTFRDCQRRAPLVPKDVEADAAIRVDIGVVDTGGEVDLWGLKGIVGREVDGEEEDAARIRGFALTKNN